MTTKALPLDYARPALLRPAALPLFLCEATAALGNNLLDVGIFFYTQHYLQWETWMNLALGATKGTAYVMGALLADRVSRRFRPRPALTVIYLVMAALAVSAGFITLQPLWIAILVAYSFVSAMNWPMLEAGVCADLDAHQLSRRVGAYNLVWSGVGALAVAASGTIIQFSRSGLFLLPAAAHVIAVGLIVLWRQVPAGASPAHVHLAAEEQLLRKRTLALWLSRIALPSIFVVLTAMMAIMPSLPVIQSLGSTAAQTVVGSVWMITRWLAFLALGATVWWHTRPRVLLLCAAGMLVAFLGITLRPSDLAGLTAGGHALDVTSMVLWQVVLGVCMGMIYTASLYFGMVLSQGSTEHGGYHEALIGLGSAVGPGAAAVTQAIFRGNLHASIGTVAAVLAVSLAAALVADAVARRRNGVVPAGS